MYSNEHIYNIIGINEIINEYKILMEFNELCEEESIYKVLKKYRIDNIILKNYIDIFPLQLILYYLHKNEEIKEENILYFIKNEELYNIDLFIELSYNNVFTYNFELFEKYYNKLNLNILSGVKKINNEFLIIYEDYVNWDMLNYKSIELSEEVILNNEYRLNKIGILKYQKIPLSMIKEYNVECNVDVIINDILNNKNLTNEIVEYIFEKFEGRFILHIMMEEYKKNVLNGKYKNVEDLNLDIINDY